MLFFFKVRNRLCTDYLVEKALFIYNHPYFGRSYSHYYYCCYYYYYNHNYNKIVKFDWLSTALISALIGQFNRTVRVMP